jgi:hypothetical protein
MTAAKKSAAVRKRDRRPREREQPRAATLRELTPVIEENIKQGVDLSEFLIPPIVEKGKSKEKK